jgi:hypothetical protein
VSTKNRQTYLKVLENFRDPKTGIIRMQDVREANRLMRSGIMGGKLKTKKAIETMRSKGMIRNAKDLTRIIKRSAVSRMGEAFTRRDDLGSGIRRAREKDPTPPNHDQGPSVLHRP